MAAQPTCIGIVATPENHRAANTCHNLSSLSYRGPARRRHEKSSIRNRGSQFGSALLPTSTLQRLRTYTLVTCMNDVPASQRQQLHQERKCSWSMPRHARRRRGTPDFLCARQSAHCVPRSDRDARPRGAGVSRASGSGRALAQTWPIRLRISGFAERKRLILRGSTGRNEA
jgi:hypothetical protein